MARPPAPPKPPYRSDPNRWDDETWLMPLPVPDAREGGESTWALWHEAARQLDVGFAPTQPSAPAPLTSSQPRVEPGTGGARPLTADAVMTIARRQNRVCPRPAAWSELYRLLEGERYADLQPPPVEPWIWTKLSHLQKRLRLREHIEWAERHGLLAEVARFIEDLPEEEWVHMG